MTGSHGTFAAKRETVKMNGVEAAREIHRIAPLIKILILSMHESAMSETAGLVATVDGFVSKTAVEAELIKELKRVVTATATAHEGSRIISLPKAIPE